MKKLGMSLIVFFILFSPLYGCTKDSNEVDEQVYTLVIGCDKAVDNKVRITIQFPVYSGNSGKKSSGTSNGTGVNPEGSTLIETIEAPSILEGINLLNSATTRKISLMHIKAIIFSEVMAREGIGAYMEPLARFRETRRIMQVIVCRGSAEAFVRENKTLIGESTAKALELASMQSINTGYFPPATFQDFYEGVISPYRMPYTAYAGLNKFKNIEELEESGGLPSGTSENSSSNLKTHLKVKPGDLPRQGNRQVELLGTAIFNGDKMIGSLDGYETRFFLMIINRFERGIITIEDANSVGSAIPLDVRLGRKPKIKAYFKDGKPVIDVKLNIEADIGAIQSRIPYEKLGRIEELNAMIKDFIQKGITETINKTQKDYNADIFGFGKFIAWRFSTVTEFEEYNWLKHYKDAEVNVDVEANVRRTGLMFGSSPFRNNKDTIKSMEE